MDKLKLTAFKWHLLISFLVISLITFGVAYYWFPYPLLMLDGTWLPLLLIACVDLIIGPAITLLVVHSRKKPRELITDFIVIASCQIAALTFGLNQITNERIVALVHLDEAFHLVTQKDIGTQQLPQPIDKNTLLNLPLAMIDESELGTHYSTTEKDILFTAQQYKPLDYDILSQNTFNRALLPSKLAALNTNDVIFKIVVGKQRNAVIALNLQAQAIDIALLPPNEELLKEIKRQQLGLE